MPEPASVGGARSPSLDLGAAPRMRLTTRVKRFLRDHGRKVWWLHSAYALAIGTGVVVFARQGFAHARWMAVTLGIAWLLVVLVFRLYASGGEMRAFDAADARTRVRFYVMTYALKNLYQGMLFFLLPFYWRSMTWGAPNAWFVLLLTLCAVVSTFDLVFDRVLLRVRVLASIFHALTLFACINLIVPALFPNTRTLWSLMWAAALSVASFWTIHVRASSMKSRINILLCALSLACGVALASLLRVAIPPVPMHLSSAAVGPSVLPDGRLAMEVRSLNEAVITQLLAITDVVVPGGKGDRLTHVWRHDGVEVHRATEDTSRVEGPSGTVRLRSDLSGGKLPPNLVGSWSVDVETDDGQLVGRTEFVVTQ
jgi:hypothetical protein